MIKKTNRRKMSGFSTSEAEVLQRQVDANSTKFLLNEKCDLKTTFELEKCISWLKNGNFKKVCLQFPDSLLKFAADIALYFQSELLESDFFILGDTSYGSCCVDEVAAMHVDADSLIHFGSACLSPNNRIPVFYVFPYGDLNFDLLMKEVANLPDDKDCFVFYDTMYYRFENQLKEKFNNSNTIVAGLAQNDNCDKTLCNRVISKPPTESATALYIGPESMTLTNLIIALPELNWFRYENGPLTACNHNTSRFLMKRSHLVEQVKGARVLGIVVATLAVSEYLDAVARIKCLAKKRGKKVYVFSVGKPNVAKLANFPEIDVFVLVACLENPLYLEFSEFYKPIVSLFEVEVALGGRPWTTACTFNFRDLLRDKIEVTENENNEPDFSLVSGKITGPNTPVEHNIGMEIVARDSGALMEITGSDYLASRSWHGLELGSNLDEKKEVKLAETGRSGVAIFYQNESKNTEASS